MVLHRDHRSIRIERAIRIAQPQDVGELQRRGAGKQNFARGSEFDDGAFLHCRVVRLTAISRAVVARELNRNANRCGFGEKTRQLRDRAGLRPPNWCCGWLRQAMMTLSPLRTLVPTGTSHSRRKEGSGVEEPTGSSTQ